MQAKDKCLGKIRFIFILFFILQNFINTSFASEILNELTEYNLDLKNSSALFIQSDGETVQEGKVYVGIERIRIDYFKPNKITIILSKNKGVYINHGLKEVEYFSTKKNFTKIFLKIFIDKDFFNNTKIDIDKNSIFISKIFTIDEKKIKTKVVYEKNPTKIRKIYLSEENYNLFELGFFNHEDASFFPKNFFSMASPYLDN